MNEPRKWNPLSHMHTGIKWRLKIKEGEEYNIDDHVWIVKDHGWQWIGNLYREEAIELVMVKNKLNDVEIAIEANKRIENNCIPKEPFNRFILIKR